MTAEMAHPVVYGGALVALVGTRRCQILNGNLDAPTLRFVATMCLYNREVEAGNVPGRFKSERAARWARSVLIDHAPALCDFDLSDDALAAQLLVPATEVAAARRELRLSFRARRPRLTDGPGRVPPDPA